MSATVVPAIPSVTQDNIIDVARAVKNIIDVREGKIGDPLDANVTFRDLLISGIAKENLAYSARVKGEYNPVLPPQAEPDGYDPTQDYLSPPLPTSLATAAGMTSIQLTWDRPVYRNHAYTEVWRASTNSLGSAVRIGTTTATLYADSVGKTSQTYYYWIRFISEANVSGPYNATSGVVASTGLIGGADLSNLIIDASKLVDGSVTSTKIANLAVGNAAIANGAITNAKIGALAVDTANIANAAIVDAKVASLDASKITTGFLDANRIQAGTINAKITNIDAAVIQTGYIYAARINTASISNATISALQLTSGTIGGDINSSNYSSGSSGWKIWQGGSAEFNGIVLSRNMVVASGSLAVYQSRTYFAGNTMVCSGRTYYDIDGEIWFDTGISSDSWGATNQTYVLTAGLNGNGITAYYNAGSPGVVDVFIEVLSLTYQWSWYGGPHIWAKLKMWVASTGGSVNSFALAYYGAGGIDWKLYKVT